MTSEAAAPAHTARRTAPASRPEVSRWSRIEYAVSNVRFSGPGVRADTLWVDTLSGLSDAANRSAATDRNPSTVATDDPSALRDYAVLMPTLNEQCPACRCRALVNRARATRHARDVHGSLERFVRFPSAPVLETLAARVARGLRPAWSAGCIQYFVERLVQAADSTLVRVTA